MKISVSIKKEKKNTTTTTTTNKQNKSKFIMCVLERTGTGESVATAKMCPPYL